MELIENYGLVEDIFSRLYASDDITEEGVLWDAVLNNRNYRNQESENSEL